MANYLNFVNLGFLVFVSCGCCVTNSHHKLGGLKQQTFTLTVLEGRSCKSVPAVSAGHTPSEVLWEIFLLFQPLVLGEFLLKKKFFFFAYLFRLFLVVLSPRCWGGGEQS